MTLPLPPAPAPVPVTHGWTAERKALFLDRLAAHGNARAACRGVGLSAEAAYRLRRRDPLFARAWAAALVLARENGLQVLGERAIEGVEEEIYYRGELVGSRRRYDSRLLLAHLARLDRLVDEDGAGADAGRFDELVACIASDAASELPQERAAFIEDAAKAAAEALRQAETHAYFVAATEGADDAAPDPAGDWAGDEDEEFQDYLEEVCREAAERARAAAGIAWEHRRDRAFETVDDLCAASLTSPAGCADGPTALLSPDTARRIAGPMGADEVGTAGAADGGKCFPWTMSTASTSALARALAGPPPARAATPRSPFHVPRS